jgi:predicted ribosome quality control (RQC) complex YloA/Tae2 family protein
MSLSPAELMRVAQELQRLVGARVQKLYVPGPRTVVLELRVPGQSALLLLEASPGVGRAGIVASRPASPAQPIAMQGLWRNHLTGARLDHLEARPALRTLTLRFSTDGGPRTVILEIAGRGGDVLLLDGVPNVIAFGVQERARDRGLVRGQAYHPPELPAATEGKDRIGEVTAGTFPVSEAIERLYGVVTEERRRVSLHTEVIAPLRAARKRLARTREKVEGDRARITEATHYQRLGDLLKPTVGRLKRGDTEARVIEYAEDGPHEVVVPLLPQISPRENMERYYHLHRRLTRSADRVDERLELLARQVAQLDGLIARAEAATTSEELEAVLSAAHVDGLLRPTPTAATKGAGPTARIPYREFRSAAGQRLWVGKNARDNDALTFRVARGNDLWLHARGQTGSHVVVPGVGPGGPDGETLLDAATLAAHFSAARNEPFTEVAATRRKYVHKPKGACGWSPSASPGSSPRRDSRSHQVDRAEP